MVGDSEAGERDRCFLNTEFAEGTEQEKKLAEALGGVEGDGGEGPGLEGDGLVADCGHEGG